MLVPSQLVALLERPGFGEERCGSLEMICSVGAPLHLEHKQELERRLPGRFYELYGLTEGFVDGARPGRRRPQARLGRGAAAALRDADRRRRRAPICRRARSARSSAAARSRCPGYYKRPDLTAETIRDGWIYTGDLGYVDEDGFLYLVDRKKDLIISGGVNVYPRDIEEVVARHAAVAEVAVFGVRGRALGRDAGRGRDAAGGRDRRRRGDQANG